MRKLHNDEILADAARIIDATVLESNTLSAGYRCNVCKRPYLTEQSACFLCSTINSVHLTDDLTQNDIARAKAPRVRVQILPKRPVLPFDPDDPSAEEEALRARIEHAAGRNDDTDDDTDPDSTEDEDEDEDGGDDEYGEAPETFGLDDVDDQEVPRVLSGVTLFDDTLGGGLVLGMNHLFSGSPGLGKSTLTLQILAGLCRHGPVLYATGEEPVRSITGRARRLGLTSSTVRKHLLITRITTIEEFFAACREHNPVAAVCDSLQSVRSAAVPNGQAGKPRVMSAAAHAAMDFAKTMETAFIYIGHARKDGSPAGLNDVMHYMDTLIEIRRESGAKESPRRILRVTKSRTCGEKRTKWLMTDKGLFDIRTAENASDGNRLTLASSDTLPARPKNKR